MKIYTMVALSVLVVSSCGEQKKDYSGALGSCTMSMPVIGEVCAEYTYSAKEQKDDPKTTAQSQMEASCKTNSGTWSATGTCATTASLGTCSSTSTSGEASVTAKLFYYSGAAITTEIAQASCGESGGTFTAP